jgi:hypothetical protein
LGVQFHPELTVAMIKLLMDAMRAKHAAASIDLDLLDASLAETAEGPRGCSALSPSGVADLQGCSARR